MAADARTAIETLRHSPIAHGSPDGDPAKATVEWTSAVANALLDVAEAVWAIRAHADHATSSQWIDALDAALDRLAETDNG